MNSSQPLFSLEEALLRLGQTNARGSLLIFNNRESIHIFVRDGSIVAALGGSLSGQNALDRAFVLEESAYRWVAGAEPELADLAIDIGDYVSNNAQNREIRGKTIKMAVYEKKEKKLDFQYYFVPEEAPHSKLRLKKATNVAGREVTCDLYIESFQVSRRHCLLQITDRGVLVKDLESTNGTFVNGIPMMDGYINDGDRLGLGTYMLTLRREKIELPKKGD